MTSDVRYETSHSTIKGVSARHGRGTSDSRIRLMLSDRAGPAGLCQVQVPTWVTSFFVFQII